MRPEPADTLRLHVQAAKDLLQELVVWPMLNPALCQVRSRLQPLGSPLGAAHDPARFPFKMG